MGAQRGNLGHLGGTEDGLGCGRDGAAGKLVVDNVGVKVHTITGNGDNREEATGILACSHRMDHMRCLPLDTHAPKVVLLAEEAPLLPAELKEALLDDNDLRVALRGELLDEGATRPRLNVGVLGSGIPPRLTGRVD